MDPTEVVEGILRDAAQHFQDDIPQWQDNDEPPFTFMDALYMAYAQWAPDVSARVGLIETLKQMGIQPPRSFELLPEKEADWDHVLAELVESAFYQELGRRHPTLKQLDWSL